MKDAGNMGAFGMPLGSSKADKLLIGMLWRGEGSDWVLTHCGCGQGAHDGAADHVSHGHCLPRG